MDKKKLFLWVGGGLLAILVIVGAVIGGNVIHKSNQANDAKDSYTKGYKDADKGKTDSSKKLENEANKIKKSGSKAEKKALSDAQKGKNGSKSKEKDSKDSDKAKNGNRLLDKVFPNKDKVYGQYNGINRATLDDVRDFMAGRNGTKGQYKKVLDNYSTGSINMPSINTKLPIIEGTSDQHLLAGADTFRPNQSITHGNYVLLGHNVGYDGMLFSSVPELKKGDKVTVNSYADGKMMQQKYEVTKKETVKSSEGHVLDDTDDRRLTLITCNVAHETPYRVVVTAKPI